MVPETIDLRLGHALKRVEPIGACIANPIRSDVSACASIETSIDMLVRFLLVFKCNFKFKMARAVFLATCSDASYPERLGDGGVLSLPC